MNSPAIVRRVARALAIALQVALLLVVVAGVAARIAELPHYVPDSGDEWGNTVAPLRILYERGNPGGFLHPALYYDVTAAADALLFAALKLSGGIDRTLSMSDLMVAAPRYFVLVARAVSVAAAVLSMAALYGLGRRLWGSLAGLLAAALLAVLPLHAVYSEAARVDSLFLAVFLYALLCILRLLDDAQPRTYRRAGLWTGLATAANYNGAILLPWLIAAHLLQRRDPRAATDGRHTAARALYRALGLALAAFVATNPSIVFRAATFLHDIVFQSVLSWMVHPGAEARDPGFYVTQLWTTSPLLGAAIAVGALAVALCGARSERFVLSLGAAYFGLFSLVRTKYDRFILPAFAVGLLMASGLPFVLARRFAARRVVVALSYVLCLPVLLACIATVAPQAIPVPRHHMLPLPGDRLFAWLEDNAPPGSTILVESGLLPLIDVIKEPGPLAAALRRSLVASRPQLDQRYIGAVYLGGYSNYRADLLTAEGVDFAVISLRNVQYVERRCDAFADVCAFYRDLRDRGRIVYQTPEGVESAVIYDVRAPEPSARNPRHRAPASPLSSGCDRLSIRRATPGHSRLLCCGARRREAEMLERRPRNTVPAAMRIAPPLDPRARCGARRQRHALLINPFYAKDVHASFGKHVLTPSLALTSIAGATPPAWTVAYWDENLLQGPPPLDPFPAVVGITVHLTFARRAYALARWYRERGAIIVLGGLHVLSCPDEATPHADALAIGDGVRLWPRILADVDGGLLRPTAAAPLSAAARRYRADFVQPYRDDPPPRRDVLPRWAFLTTASLIATRGCHNRCGFCYLSTRGLTLPYQRRDVAQVVAELRAAGQPYAVFIDNNLGSDRAYLRALCRALRPLEKIWSAAVTIDVTDEPALLREMALAGCTGVFIGFESLEDRNLADAHKRTPRAAEYAQRVRLLHEHGIAVNGSFVLGFDQDGPEVFARTIEWIEATRLECATFHILTPYPGTPLFRQLEREGRLLHRNWDLYDTAHVVFRPRRMSAEQLAEGYAWCYRRLFTHRSIWARRPRDLGALAAVPRRRLPLQALEPPLARPHPAPLGGERVATADRARSPPPRALSAPAPARRFRGRRAGRHVGQSRGVARRAVGMGRRRGRIPAPGRGGHVAAGKALSWRAGWRCGGRARAAPSAARGCVCGYRRRAARPARRTAWRRCRSSLPAG